VVRCGTKFVEYLRGEAGSFNRDAEEQMFGAAALGLTTAAISAMATPPEAGGYAHRGLDPHDRRRVLLRASPAGARQAFSLFDSLYQAAASPHTR
jgi:hypothetical protein